MVNKYETEKTHLLRAIEIAGGQCALAEKIGRNQQFISSLMRRSSSIKADVAVRISAAVDGKVSIEDLIADFTPNAEAA